MSHSHQANKRCPKHTKWAKINLDTRSFCLLAYDDLSKPLASLWLLTVVNSLFDLSSLQRPLFTQFSDIEIFLWTCRLFWRFLSGSLSHFCHFPGFFFCHFNAFFPFSEFEFESTYRRYFSLSFLRFHFLPNSSSNSYWAGFSLQNL